MNKKTEKICIIITIIFFSIAFPFVFWGVLNINRWYEWFTFENIFEPYKIIGGWYIPIIIAFTLIYAYVVFGGKKVEEDEENHGVIV